MHSWALRTRTGMKSSDTQGTGWISSCACMDALADGCFFRVTIARKAVLVLSGDCACAQIWCPERPGIMPQVNWTLAVVRCDLDLMRLSDSFCSAFWRWWPATETITVEASTTAPPM